MKLLEKVESILSKELPKLMHTIDPPKQEQTNNPFDAPENQTAVKWDIPPAAIEKFGQMFGTLPLQDGYLSGGDARQVLLSSGLDADVLRDIWSLSDFEKRGKLDREEFILAMFLVHSCKKGGKLPAVLPPLLIPPSKRI